jgi:hypothetical protein
MKGNYMKDFGTVTIKLTEKELVFLTSLVESEKTRMFFEDPEVDKKESALHEDYSLSESLVAKFGQSYAFGN